MTQRAGRTAATIAIMTLVALAGCTASPANDTAQGTAIETANLPSPRIFAASTTHCEGVALIITMAREEAQAFLPPGYIARDASGIAQLDLPTGRVPIFMVGMECPSLGDTALSHAFTAVFIEAPHDDIGNESESMYDMYEVHHFVENGSFAQALKTAGFRASEASIVARTDHTQKFGQHGELWVVDDSGEQMWIHGLAPTYIPRDTPALGFSDWVLRSWHDGTHSIGVAQYSFTFDAPVGAGAYCAQTQLVPGRPGEEENCPINMSASMTAGAGYAVTFADFAMEVEVWHESK